MRRNYLFIGFSLLLLAAYLDNLRGSLMPVIAMALSLSYGQMSWFLIAGNIVAVLCTFLLIPLISRFGKKDVTIVLCLFAAIGAVISHWVTNYSLLMVLACFVGVTIASFGAISNVWVVLGVDARFRSRFLCGLHMMYGLGSLVAPSLVGLLLMKNVEWPWFFSGLIPLFLFLCLYSGRSVAPQKAKRRTVETVRFSMFQAFIVFIFSIYVAGEVITSMWMVTYLVESHQLTVVESTRYATGFFAMMAATRALAFFLDPKYERTLLVGSVFLAPLFFLSGHLGFLWGFAFTGIMGPYFPLLLSRVSHRFPETWRSLMLWILTSMQLTLGICHFSIGRLTDYIGISTTYRIPLVLMLAALISLLLYLKLEKQLVYTAEHN